MYTITKEYEEVGVGQVCFGKKGKNLQVYYSMPYNSMKVKGWENLTQVIFVYVFVCVWECAL